MAGKKSYGRKINRHDRGAWGKNALKGTEKWHLTPHAMRVEERKHPSANWGFVGSSPHTLNREEAVQIKQAKPEEIHLDKPAEVKYAHSIGAIRIDKKLGIEPVRGKSYIKDGKLFYKKKK